MNRFEMESEVGHDSGFRWPVAALALLVLLWGLACNGDEEAEPQQDPAAMEASDDMVIGDDGRPHFEGVADEAEELEAELEEAAEERMEEAQGALQNQEEEADEDDEVADEDDEEDEEEEEAADEDD